MQGTEPRAQDRYLRGLNLRALVKDQAQTPSKEINRGTLSTRLLFSQQPNDLLLVIESAAAANLHEPHRPAALSGDACADGKAKALRQRH